MAEHSITYILYKNFAQVNTRAHIMRTISPTFAPRTHTARVNAVNTPESLSTDHRHSFNSHCVPMRSCFERINGQLESAHLNTMSLFRRRFNEHSEHDVLRHDAHLFGVEPLTNAYSFGDVFEPDENFFGDGITRRSAKRSQAVQPPLERRGALSECRAPTKH